MAEQLFISQKTVKNHLASIYQKLDARDRTQAVLQAVRMGIVTPSGKRVEEVWIEENSVRGTFRPATGGDAPGGDAPEGDAPGPDGEERPARQDLLRLAIPRRVYTQAHMDVVAQSVVDLYARRDRIRGLKMVYEPEYLRFFQARFEPIA